MSEKFQPLDVAIPDEAGWPKKTLDELCSLISRGTAPVYVESSSVLAIGQRCVTTSRFAPEFARPHSERAMRNVLRPEPGDVLLNSTGTGTIGRSVVFGHDGSFIVDGHVTVLRPKPESADGRWLNTVLRTSWGQRHLERFCYAGSTNQLELSRTPVKASMLPVPLLAEQHAIAQILDTLDTAIRETEALIDKLKAVKQGLLHDLLTRGIDANGQLRPPQSEAPQLYKESPLGWIPREWELSPLGNISSRIGDGVHYAVERSHDGVPFLFVSCVRNGKIDWQGASFVPPKTYLEISKRSKPVKGMVLFTVVGSYGHAAHVDDELDFGFERNIAFVIPNSKYLHSRYLFYSVSSEAARTQVERLVIGNAQKVLTLAALNSIVVPLPSLSEQAQIISRLDALNERQEHEQFAFEKLLVQRKGLMDDLLTGRIRVTPLLDSMPQPAAQTGA